MRVTQLLGFILLLCPWTMTWSAAPRPLPTDAAGSLGSLNRVLLVGESLNLPLSPAESASVQVEKSGAIKVQPSSKGLRVIALKPGASDIQTVRQRHRFSVLAAKQYDTYRFLKSWVQKNPGLQVQVERGEVKLTGKLFHPRSWIGIAEACPHCSYTAEFQTFPDREAEIRSGLESFLKKRSLPRPALRLQPQLLWSVNKVKASGALQQAADALGLKIVTEDDAVDVAPLVRTQIFVMEVRREFTRKYGISWPGSVSAQIIPGEAAAIAPLDFSAQALENEGQAKILANPTLLCRSGEEAEFLAGGEFPIKMLNYHAHDVIWKKYGIVLKVKPKADRWGRMSLTLETEISSIDSARTVDGVPGLFTNRVLSHFDLEESATIAISGLIKNEEGKSLQGLPGLSSLPILGALFGSKEFRENRTELIIFVRPQVVDLKAERNVTGGL